jgi:hypothetical protein
MINLYNLKTLGTLDIFEIIHMTMGPSWGLYQVPTKFWQGPDWVSTGPGRVLTGF